MNTVETALGSVATSELGATLMHEHIVRRSPGVQENWPHPGDRGAILAIAEGKMADLYARGIRSIVDLTRTRPLWHYNHISDDILPALRKAAVTEDQIEQMLVRNPRAIFETRQLGGA
jgi:predicted metal-dependent phosphotriesterase family hydrolase